MTEPKIRFQEYNAEWVEYPLEDILTENLDPVATPREGYRRVGIYCHAKGTFQEDVPADKVLDVDTMYKIHKDNLIVNITFAWEHAIAIVKPEDEGMLVSHRFPEYEFNKGHIPSFYKYLILRPYMKNQLSLASPGGAGRNRVLNKKQFMQIPVYVPCEAEQQKIADFLNNVDEVIAASEEEVTNLEQQKKAVMQEIFSQEVRFKKEDGSDFPDWEEIRLGDHLIQFTDITTENNQYPALTSSRKGIFLQENYFNRQVASEDNTGYNIVPYGYFTYRHMSDDAVFHFNINYIVENGIVSTLYPVFTTDSAIDDNFLQHYLNESPSFAKYCIMQKQGGSRTYMYFKKLSAYVGYIPSLPEQQLIADFLTCYDEAITAAKQELEKWKELKKGLLQQMFV